MGKYVHEIYHDVSSLLDYVCTEEGIANERNKGEYKFWAKEDKVDVQWYGLEGSTINLQQVCEITRTGWKDGAKRFSDMLQSISVPAIKSVRRQRVWSDNGDHVDLSRVYSGHLDRAWQRTKRTGNNPPRVLIVVNSIAVGVMDAECMFWRGAAASALALSLSRAGYPVQVRSSFRGVALSSGSERMHLDCIVKDYHTVLTDADAAATCALPAFFRMIGHTWYAKTCPSDLSSPGLMVTDDIRVGDYRDDPTSNYAFLSSQSVQTKKTAQAWIKSCIEQLEGGRNE